MSNLKKNTTETESIMLITRSDEDELVMSVYGDRRHSYFIGVLSEVVHRIQHQSQEGLYGQCSPDQTKSI